MLSEGMTDLMISLFAAVPIFFLPAVFPLIAIFYGWYTKNRVAAALLGAVPFPLLMTAGIALQGFTPVHTDWLAMAIVYYLSLAGIGGLSGYFASFKTRKHLAAALGLAVVWVIVFFSGIN